ncbi:MAG: guanylate kinase [Candidatus Omnitrophica bacterium]|nr:guanylate kinase [Candidatus Omnitrophota bacterium]
MKRPGTIFIVSGPSGSGKTTLCKGLLKKRRSMLSAPSMTTRAPRKGEKKNIDYIFVSETEFKKQLKEGGLLEHAVVFGNYYGTPKKPIADALKQGKDVLLSIDIQGAAQVKKAFKAAVLIFVLPPTFTDLKERLLKRSSDTAEQIRKRLRKARQELKAVDAYDHTVVNDDIKKAVERLYSIVAAATTKKR